MVTRVLRATKETAAATVAIFTATMWSMCSKPAKLVISAGMKIMSIAPMQIPAAARLTYSRLALILSFIGCRTFLKRYGRSSATC
jgi:hypothetical protein